MIGFEDMVGVTSQDRAHGNQCMCEIESRTRRRLHVRFQF